MAMIQMPGGWGLRKRIPALNAIRQASANKKGHLTAFGATAVTIEMRAYGFYAGLASRN
jgi:hypothetical protein